MLGFLAAAHPLQEPASAAGVATLTGFADVAALTGTLPHVSRSMRRGHAPFDRLNVTRGLYLKPLAFELRMGSEYL